MNGSFKVGGKALAGAVKFAARWLATKPVIPAHGGLLFEVDGDRLSIFGFNENATAKATVEIDASDEPKGGFVVAGRLIDHLAATFGDRPVTIEQSGSNVTLKVGTFRTTLPVLSEQDYPALPGQAALAGYVNGDDLADAIRRVGGAASRDLTMQIALCGLHVSFDEDGTDHDGHTLTFMATDTYRGARQQVRWEPDDEAAPFGEAFLTMAASMVDACDFFSGSTIPVALGWEDGVVSLTTPTRSLVLRTLKVEDFPAAGLAPIFNSSPSAAATLKVKDLTLPMKRAEVLRSASKSDAVTVRLTTNLLTIESERNETGEGDEEVAIAYNGPETSMSFKASVLIAALGSAPSDEVTLSFTPDTFKPAVITSAADPTWRHVLVPLRPTK
jgi:DNA polymerase-3 subunit beta